MANPNDEQNSVGLRGWEGGYHIPRRFSDILGDQGSPFVYGRFLVFLEEMI